MTLVIVAVVVVAFTDSVLSKSLLRHKRWSQSNSFTEPNPKLTGLELIDVLTLSPEIRYTDWGKKLTAVKSSKYGSCFIADLDPNVFLPEPEMRRITAENKPQVIDSPPAFNDLRLKAGPYITPMCQQLGIYWLSSLTPLPLLANKGNVTLSRPTEVVVTATPSPTNGAPPPVDEFRKQMSLPPLEQQQQHTILTPPPPDVLMQQQQHTTILTPPPPDVLMQQQQHTTILTPPPLEDWLQQHQHTIANNGNVTLSRPIEVVVTATPSPTNDVNAPPVGPPPADVYRQ